MVVPETIRSVVAGGSDNLITNGTFEGDNLQSGYLPTPPQGWTLMSGSGGSGPQVHSFSDGADVYLNTSNIVGATSGLQQDTGVSYNSAASYNLTLDVGSNYQDTAPVTAEIFVDTGSGLVSLGSQTFTLPASSEDAFVTDAIDLMIPASASGVTGTLVVQISTTANAPSYTQALIDNVSLTTTDTSIGDGDDTITGGLGDDVITGGTGDDTFIYVAGDGSDTITDFGTGNSGSINDGDQSNNDFMDLSRFYDHISELQDDFNDDGVLNQSNAADYSDNDSFGSGGLTFTGGVVSSAFNSDTTNVTCFTRGTLIKTDQGERPIEELAAGDMVLTMDHGYQPIRWIGSSKRAATGDLAPILIRKGALGNDRDLRVSPQHRMLLQGWQAEMLFGELEVLATAKSLLNDHSILRDEGGEVEYFHMLFDTHEIIYAEGCLSESFHPGKQGWKALDQATRDEILTLFPQLADGNFNDYGPAARMSLKHKEGKLLGSYMAGSV